MGIEIWFVCRILWHYGLVMKWHLCKIHVMLPRSSLTSLIDYLGGCLQLCSRHPSGRKALDTMELLIAGVSIKIPSHVTVTSYHSLHLL